MYVHSQEPDRASTENGDIGGGSHRSDSGHSVDRHCEGFHLRRVRRVSTLGSGTVTNESTLFQGQVLG